MPSSCDHFDGAYDTIVSVIQNSELPHLLQRYYNPYTSLTEKERTLLIIQINRSRDVVVRLVEATLNVESGKLYFLDMIRVLENLALDTLEEADKNVEFFIGNIVALSNITPLYKSSLLDEYGIGPIPPESRAHIDRAIEAERVQITNLIFSVIKVENVTYYAKITDAIKRLKLRLRKAFESEYAGLIKANRLTNQPSSKIPSPLAS